MLLRITTRLAHSRAGVTTTLKIKDQNEISFPDNTGQFILLPANSRRRFRTLLNEQKDFTEASENSSFNRYIDGPNKKMGIIACGIAYNYLMENYPEGCDYPVVKLSQYPLPLKMLQKLFDTCDEILVLEDGYAFVEEKIKGIIPSKIIKGQT